MKIALILPNLNGGGAEKAMLNIGHGLEARGHEIHLILFGAKFHYQSKLTTHLVTKKSAKKSFLGKRKTARALRKLYIELCSKREFDFAVSTLPYTDEVVNLAGIPNVWYRIANTLSEEIKRGTNKSALKTKILLRRYRKLYSGKNIIAISHGVKSDITDRLEIRPNSIKMIYNSYPLERIRRLADEPVVFEDPYIIHVGRFNPQKRHDLLFEAFSSLPLPHKLVLLTHKSEALQSLIDRYGLSERVYVAGFQENPYPWIKGADLLVLCSDFEGLANVLIESLIVGTKVLSTDCPSGPKEIVGNLANHCLVPTGDVPALREAIYQSVSREFELPDGFTQKFSETKTLDLYESCARFCQAN